MLGATARYLRYMELSRNARLARARGWIVNSLISNGFSHRTSRETSHSSPRAGWRCGYFPNLSPDALIRVPNPVGREHTPMALLAVSAVFAVLTPKHQLSTSRSWRESLAGNGSANERTARCAAVPPLFSAVLVETPKVSR